MYVTERTGTVRIVNTDGTLVSTPVLTVPVATTDEEEGLLGLVFSPDGTKLYVDYTDTSGNINVVEYTMAGDVADTTTRRPLLLIPHPTYTNHNGGELVFGADGDLYIGVGDGGGVGDPQGNAQNTNVLLGKILRINPTPSVGLPYTIPADNPFVGQSGKRGEIWMYGLRNPWRFSFDQPTGQLWIADVGQSLYEEIDLAAAGQSGTNFGWNLREGLHPYNGGAEPAGAQDPLIEEAHSNGWCAIVGGYVYHGAAIPNLDGAYVFGDFCRTNLVGAVQSGGVVTQLSDLSANVSQLSTFGQDASGELYAASLTGTVYKLVSGAPAQTISFPGMPDVALTQSTVTASATATSGLPVSFTTTTPTVCSAGGTNGATITLNAPGQCTVQADQIGNGTYNPAPSVPRTFNVTTTGGCPCTIFGTTVPPIPDSGDAGANVELGVKFTSDVAGTVTGVRFYKSAANTGTHTGTLWSATGTKLATATFTGETASGWQSVTFSPTVAITAGTTYVASYHTTVGHYASTHQGFATAVNSPPLHALASGTTGNGLYRYGASAFPNQSYLASNYYVDVTFVPGTTTKSDQTISFPPLPNVTQAQSPVTASATATSGLPVSFTTTTPTVCSAGGTNGATITLNAPGQCTVQADQIGNGSFNPAPSVPQTFTVASSTSGCPCTIFGTSVPAIPDSGDAGANVELGVKFTSDVAGTVTGVRFYKSAANTGTHTGTLWSATGTKLATATFTGETASGWQSVTFSPTVAITAGTTYVASYHTTVGHYASTHQGFATAVNSPPLHALASGTTGNGLYRYGASAFPNQSYLASNYYVDVTFTTP